MEVNDVLRKINGNKLPKGCHPIRTMIILKRKFDTEGKLIKYKARLVALGNVSKIRR